MSSGPVETGTAVELAFRGALSDLDEEVRRRLLERGRAGDPSVAATVSEILADVRVRGDVALRELARRFDDAAVEALEVPREAWGAAVRELPPSTRTALGYAADRIGRFHRALVPAPVEVQMGPGVRLTRRHAALGRAGVYAPGGRAAYPSSVLMGVVPARVAGVGEVFVCSPPGPTGLPSPEVLAAAEIAGADRVFAVGGAGAIAALAFGTDSVPRVDAIVGPGNAWVAEAKRQVAGTVVTDAPAGPSEILVIADDGADPEVVASELLAQAEHDPDAAAVLVALSPGLASAVARMLDRRLPTHPRSEIVRASLASAGALLWASSLDDAVAFAEAYAPEHLSLIGGVAEGAAGSVHNAGTVFVGPAASVVFGDYVTGANHTLPTGGLSRAMSGLSVEAFLRTWTVQEVTAEGASDMAEQAAVLAEAEGLPGHAAAARLRLAGPAASSTEEASSPPIVSPPSAIAAPASVPTRPSYGRLQAYDPERPPLALDLSDNTNRFGAAPRALDALAADERSAEACSRYPDVYADRLCEAIAAHHGVDPENVVTGCGSDDVLDSAIRAFLEPGSVLVHPDPTFGMVPVFAAMNGVETVAVASPTAAGGESFEAGRQTDIAPFVERIREAAAAAAGAASAGAAAVGATAVSAGARAVSAGATAVLAGATSAAYLCRPNNPTGDVVPAEAVRLLDRSFPGLVLLDEAYADYAGEELTAWAASSTRTISLRTFSKAWGLAGLRVGYAVGPAELIGEVRKSRGPYKVGALAERAALAALEHDDAWRTAIVRRTIDARDALAAKLRELGLSPLPSSANFLLVPVADAVGARDALRARGVGVRAFRDLPGIGDAIRVTIGPAAAMARALDALTGAMEGGRVSAGAMQEARIRAGVAVEDRLAAGDVPARGA